MGDWDLPDRVEKSNSKVRIKIAGVIWYRKGI
jgi:hypothetical protein